MGGWGLKSKFKLSSIPSLRIIIYSTSNGFFLILSHDMLIAFNNLIVVLEQREFRNLKSIRKVLILPILKPVMLNDKIVSMVMETLAKHVIQCSFFEQIVNLSHYQTAIKIFIKTSSLRIDSHLQYPLATPPLLFLLLAKSHNRVRNRTPQMMAHQYIWAINKAQGVLKCPHLTKIRTMAWSNSLEFDNKYTNTPPTSLKPYSLANSATIKIRPLFFMMLGSNGLKKIIIAAGVFNDQTRSFLFMCQPE